MTAAVFTATEMGWQLRTDLGPDVWERPDGTLIRAAIGTEPAVTIVDNTPKRDP